MVKIVANFKIDKLEDNVGFICTLKNENNFTGTIQNLTLKNAVIKGKNSVGSFVGKSENSPNIFKCQNIGEEGSVSGIDNVGGIAGYFGWQIDSSINSVSVSGTGDNTGGIVGYTTANPFRCYNTAEISGKKSVGGVIGCYKKDLNIGGNPTQNYNKGNVSANENVGGVIGYVEHKSASIYNNYNTGTVSGTENVGGVFGYFDGESSRNYSIGVITSSATYAGGIVGYRQSGSSSVSLSLYYKSDSSLKGIGNINDDIGVTSLSDKSFTIPSDWDSSWEQATINGVTRPVLKYTGKGNDR